MISGKKIKAQTLVEALLAFVLVSALLSGGFWVLLQEVHESETTYQRMKQQRLEMIEKM